MCAAKDTKPGFDSEIFDSTLKIRLHGEIDHHTAVMVRTAIDNMIRDKRPQKLIMDMSLVDFMDSSGLGLIMGRYALIREYGGNLVVSNPNPGIYRIMKLAGMERVVKIEFSKTDRQTKERQDKNTTEKRENVRICANSKKGQVKKGAVK